MSIVYRFLILGIVFGYSVCTILVIWLLKAALLFLVYQSLLMTFFNHPMQYSQALGFVIVSEVLFMSSSDSSSGTLKEAISSVLSRSSE